ncbi:MAG TPA: 1-deoxy-D-xylulose-5-phosphate reductoisomerase, partial [Actinomycetota bacterium]|nr:1-deoxy-D-xylulose-5-phosphate reductoisomerase [Actinomycetota bacterium]
MSFEPRRRLAILGSTGSIGRQALDVVRLHPHLFEVVALSAGRDEQTLAEQATEFGVDKTGLGAVAAAELAVLDDADIVLNGIVGAAGLGPSIAALEAGKILALANKESLVAGGEACLSAAERGGGRIVPVDSEHAAISQALQGVPEKAVDRICLTASGGPFLRRSNLNNVSKEDALAHPTWNMGPKVTIDSATLMNKGLEVIEAHFLFGVDFDHIDVLVHPQSIVHGMVVMKDGSVLMQAGTADMRVPIQAALTGAERIDSGAEQLDLATIASLDFERVDHNRFPSLGLAYKAGRAGGSAPAVLNAANEEAVRGFLEDRVRFVDIPAIVEETLGAHEVVPAGNLQTVLEVDTWARDH